MMIEPEKRVTTIDNTKFAPDIDRKINITHNVVMAFSIFIEVRFQ